LDTLGLADSPVYDAVSPEAFVDMSEADAAWAEMHGQQEGSDLGWEAYPPENCGPAGYANGSYLQEYEGGEYYGYPEGGGFDGGYGEAGGWGVNSCPGFGGDGGEGGGYEGWGELQEPQEMMHECWVLWVGSLPPRCTEEELLEAFQVFGPIASVVCEMPDIVNRPLIFLFSLRVRFVSHARSHNHTSGDCQVATT